MKFRALLRWLFRRRHRHWWVPVRTHDDHCGFAVRCHCGAERYPDRDYEEAQELADHLNWRIGRDV